MKKLILFSFYSLWRLGVSAQENFVLNPSFEEISSCPTNHSQLALAVGWDTLKSGGGGTLDLFTVCCSPNICGVPFNWNSSSFYNGFQYPKTGESYAGLIAYMGTSFSGREYMQTKLVQKLTQSKTYCVSFFASLSEVSEYSCVSLGAYLDNGEVQSINYQPPYPLVIPQVVNTTLLDDTLNWIKIEGSFIANGTEEYISIGNFYPDSLSGFVHSYPAAPLSGSLRGAHYFIDDVSVTEIPDVYAGNDTLIKQGDRAYLGRDTGAADAVYTWYSNGNIIDSTAGLWVQPDSTTTYILQQRICSSVSYDTVTVTVDFGVGIAVVADEARIKVYPNPSTGAIEYSVMNSNPIELVEIKVYSATGALVHQEHTNTAKGRLSFDFNNGVYYINVATKCLNKTNKVVVIK